MTRARDVANIDGLLTTTGDTYYASAAGTPARLGIGSTDQVLKVSGGVPTWATASAGGMTLIATANPSSASSFSFTSIPSTYKNLMVLIPELVWSATGNFMKMRFATGNYYSTRTIGTSAGSTAVFSTERGEPYFGNGSVNLCPVQKGFTQGGVYGDISSASVINIYNYTSTIDRIVTWRAGGNACQQDAIGIYDEETAAISNIEFVATAGNVTGTAYLYGVS